VVARDAPTFPSESEGRPQDHRQPDSLGGCHARGDRLHRLGFGDGDAGVGHAVTKDLPIFGAADRIRICADELDSEPVEHPLLAEAHRQVEAGLTAERRK
jgi:hypothetical protein